MCVTFFFLEQLEDISNNERIWWHSCYDGHDRVICTNDCKNMSYVR